MLWAEAISSIPEVLGTQMPAPVVSLTTLRATQYGYDKFFTDAKRGVVIQLRSSGAQNEQLNVISDQGMSTWFRELFQVSSTNRSRPTTHTQVSTECSNLKNLPTEKNFCGTSQTFNVTAA